MHRLIYKELFAIFQHLKCSYYSVQLTDVKHHSESTKYILEAAMACTEQEDLRDQQGQQVAVDTQFAGLFFSSPEPKAQKVSL